MNKGQTFKVLVWLCIVYLGLSNHYLRKEVKQLKEVVSEIEKGK